MALRVLLADNSETIKKVIQLTLQDYAAQVRSVNLGVDVVDVAKSFHPDIIFADILLQKRNGYEICQDIKSTPELANVPVVLIWSGFMDLDHAKVAACRANATLEKPFDSADLRNLILKLVPKTAKNTLTDFIEVPQFAKSDIQLESPTLTASETQSEKAIPLSIPTPPQIQTSPEPSVFPPTPKAAEPAYDNKWNMDSFEDISDFEIHENKVELPDLNMPTDQVEDFAQVPISQVSKKISDAPTSPKPQNLSPQNPLKKKELSKSSNEFELSVPDETDFDGVTVSIVMPVDEVTNLDFLNKQNSQVSEAQTQTNTHSVTEVTKSMQVPSTESISTNSSQTNAQTPTNSEALTASNIPQLTEAQLETLLQNQSREIIEKIVWKLVPDMAERIIREEIKRLLDEPEMRA